MESLRTVRISVLIFLICLCVENKAKLNDNKTNDHSAEVKTPKKVKHFFLIYYIFYYFFYVTNTMILILLIIYRLR